ncbi:MAG: hypothetical protein ABFS41_08790 [Myxococcota bacterium]
MEEHGDGRQYLRFRIWPKLRRGLGVAGIGALLAAAALADGAWLAAAILGGGALVLPFAAIHECGRAQGEILEALDELEAGAAAATRDEVSDRP